MYYALAHSTKKVKNVLDLLISLSLVESVAYPPLAKLDADLGLLVFDAKSTLTNLGGRDPEAAELLQTYMSGYATLRKFYDLCDAEVNLKEGHKSNLRPIARKKAAVAALLAVIASSADNIHGGLYDEDRNAVVQVDGLLALLGEATIFVDRKSHIHKLLAPQADSFPEPTRVLELPQIFSLLAAVEDLETVTPRIYSQCEECFQSTLAAAHGALQAPSPQELLKKSVSELTASSGFSLVGSEMLEGAGTSGERGATNGLLGKGKSKDVKRGWDWRLRLSKDAKGSDVLRILRLGLAKEVARTWTEV